jgi:hypothetical protein
VVTCNVKQSLLDSEVTHTGTLPAEGLSNLLCCYTIVVVVVWVGSLARFRPEIGNLNCRNHRHIGFSPWLCCGDGAPSCFIFRITFALSESRYGRGLTLIGPRDYSISRDFNARTVYIYSPYLRCAPRSVPLVALDTNESIAITAYHDKQGTQAWYQKSV